MIHDSLRYCVPRIGRDARFARYKQRTGAFGVGARGARSSSPRRAESPCETIFHACMNRRSRENESELAINVVVEGHRALYLLVKSPRKRSRLRDNACQVAVTANVTLCAISRLTSTRRNFLNVSRKLNGSRLLNNRSHYRRTRCSTSRFTN